MPKKKEPQYVTPTLESITIKGKYKIPETDFGVVEKILVKTLEFYNWVALPRIGESIRLIKIGKEIREYKDEDFHKYVKETRYGVPVCLIVTTVEHFGDGILVEVECRPALWYRISTHREVNFRENEVQEALLECGTFVKGVMSTFGGKEVEPVSVYPIIQRSEIKSRLQNLGLKRSVNLLDKAEKHIVQNNFAESLKSSRTAFEKMIDWQMKKRGLEQTNNYKNDLERLRSKGYLDKETTKLLQTYYRCLSNIAVHQRGEVQPGIFEAQMGYGITLIMLDYLANKLP